MELNFVIQILAPLIVQGVATIIAVIFVFQRAQDKMSSELNYLKKDMQLQNEQLKVIIELKLDAIIASQDSLNVRVSKLEQFKDDFYSHGLFSSLAPAKQ